MRFIPLCSGSSGNATYVEAGNARVLVDAGLSCRRLCQLMQQVEVDPATLTAILVTHEHVDHVKGAAVLSRKYHIPVYANADTWDSMQAALSDVYPPQRCVFQSDKPFYLKKLCVFPFTTPHDAAHSVGFTLSDGVSKCGVCTDLGHVDQRIIEILSDCGLVLIEAGGTCATRTAARPWPSSTVGDCATPFWGICRRRTTSRRWPSPRCGACSKTTASRRRT